MTVGNLYELQEDIRTAERTTPLYAGHVYKVTKDPANYDGVSDDCLEILHESNIDTDEDSYPAKPIVLREEFLENSEEV
jgi:hypothetical protein